MIANAECLRAADLFRVRIEVPAATEAGVPFDATVLLDNSPWPAPAADSDTSESCAVVGYTLGIRIPEGLTLLSTTFAGTVSDPDSAGGSFSATVSSAATGISIIVLPTHELSSRIPAGLGQPLLHLTLVSTGSTPEALDFSDTQDDSIAPTTLVTGRGVVVPHRIVHGPIGAAGEAATSIPPVSPEHLIVQYFDGAQANEEGGGGGALLLGSGGDGLTDACSYETLLGPPPDPDITVSPGRSIQDAIHAYPGYPAPAPSDWVVRVDPGTYVAQDIEIDVGLFAGVTLYLYANGGPDQVTLVSVVDSPAITIIETGAQPGNVVIGWSNTVSTASVAPAVHAGWNGFRITDSGGPNSSPISISGVNVGSVSLIGNWIDENAATPASSTTVGGAARVVSCSGDIRFIMNEISDNMAGSAVGEGAGVFCDGSRVFFANNWIHGNVFRPVFSDPNEQMIGGGLRLAEGDYTLCRNFIYGNNGMAGCGVHARLSGNLGGETLHLEGNEIYGNFPWTAPGGTHNVPYQGAGIHVTGELDPTPFFSHDIRLINNIVRDNSINVPSLQVGPSPTQVGGGLYFHLSYDTDNDSSVRPWFEGNAFFRNIAVYGGAGASIGCYPVDPADPLTEAFFANNTFAANELVDENPDFGFGSGIFLPRVSMLGIPVESRIAGRNCIVWGNLQQFFEMEWHAECGSGAPPADSWTTCVMPEYPSFTCSFSYDLFGSGSTNFDPELVAGAPYDPHLTDRSFAAIDVADQSILTSLISGSDHDGDPRLGGALLDRGADERVLAPFIRGDFNADGSVQISDMIMILARLFPPVPPPTPPLVFNCELSGDANDDGYINIADPIYIGAYLFPPPGPPPVPPPAPFPSCGFDSTPFIVTPPLSVPPSVASYDPCLPSGCP